MTLGEIAAMLNPDKPRHDAPWSNGPLTEESYGHYLRHQANTSERKPVPVPHLTSAQLARLDSLSRTIMLLPTVRGVYASGYRFVGATIANERGNSWYYYECRECRSDEARWLVWAFGREVGPDVLLVIPIKTDDSTAIDTRAACEAIAKVGGLDGLAASIERWVMTGETAGEAHAAP